MIPGNANPLLLATAAEAAAADVATKSLRFNSGDSAYLNRTPSSAGNRKTFTLSCWVKRCSAGSYQAFFSAYQDSNDFHHFRFRNDEKFETRLQVGGSDKLQLITDQVFRDFSAWYHVVFAYDSTQATASNRAKLYINGSQVTSFSTETYPSQNDDSYVANTTAHYIGQRGDNNLYHDGYLADVYFIDGSALAPTSFGAFDDNGVWQAAAYSGTFGTNGFHLLDFANESTVGHDSSGNDNDFTANNLVASAEYKTLTRLRFKTDWNWMYVSQITINGSALTTGTLDNTGSVWSDPDKWKNGSTGSGNETYSQSARQDWFDVTLASNISNFRDLEIYVYLDSSAGSTTNIFEVELFFSDNTSHTKTYASNSDAPNGNFNQRSNQDFGRVGLADPADLDVMFDVPTNGTQSDTGAGGEVSGCYATLNPLAKGSILTLSNGNLDVTSSGNYGNSHSTIGVSSGKWYYEYTTSSATVGLGITKVLSTGSAPGNYAGSYCFVTAGGNSYKQTGGTASSYGSVPSSGDVIGVAFDLDNGTITTYLNGSTQGAMYSSNSDISSGATFFAEVGDPTTSGNIDGSVNFGQRPWAYSAPSNHQPLCTALLPTPTIANGSDHFEASIWTVPSGNADTTISNLSFAPDWLITKNRSQNQEGSVYDTVRGDDKYLKLFSDNGSDAQTTAATRVNLTSDGFVLEADNDNSNYIAGSESVGWTWNAGTSTASNTDGSVTSSVRANQAAGFSIVGYTMGSSDITVGHGLNAEPELVITRRYSSSDSWITYHASLGKSKYLFLNGLNAAFSDTPDAFTSTNNSVFDARQGLINAGDCIAYCFSPVAGYSAISGYSGSGSSGNFIYLGFRPALIMIKSTSAYGWAMIDSKRSSYNVQVATLYPNKKDQEFTGSGHEVDFLSNGFNLRNSNDRFNKSSTDYIYYAVAENPFQANGGLAR